MGEGWGWVISESEVLFGYLFGNHLFYYINITVHSDTYTCAFNLARNILNIFTYGGQQQQQPCRRFTKYCKYKYNVVKYVYILCLYNKLLSIF